PVQHALPPEGRVHLRRHAAPGAEAGAASPPRLPHSHRGVVATPAGGARSPLVRRLPRPSPDIRRGPAGGPDERRAVSREAYAVMPSWFPKRYSVGCILKP